MNIISLLVVFVIGTVLWWRSGALPTRRYILVGLGIMFVLWWCIWGQFAVSDGWWAYSANSISGGTLGAIPVLDLLYFIGGLGWYLYFCRKLGVF